ncbi:MAG: DUF4340 domain-containing protein [Candidatus Rokuibacteriota bacterium]
MRWQTTVVLAVILVALGAFYYVYEVRLAPEREKAAARKGRVFTVEPADVIEMTLKRGDETVRIKRAGEGWEMLAPVTGRGEQGPIEETLTSVATAKMDREIAARPANVGEFGLDTPAAEATLVLKDGKQVTLRLGTKTPTGVWVYAQEQGQPSVFVVADGILRDVTRPAADFRNKTILAFDRASVTGVEIVTRDETLAVEAGENRWRLTRPRPLPADTDAVRDFLDKLGSGRIKEFVAETPRSLEPYGLERPVRVSVHTGKDGDRATKSLLIGHVDDKKKGVYAMRPGEPSVFLLPEDVWTALPRTTAALRDKTIVEFDRDKVTRLDIESPRGQVTLVREQDRWKITQPEGVPADPVEAGAVLMKLRNLRAQAFLADEAAAVPRYLGRPEVRATLTQEGREPLTVLLAPSPEKRGAQATAYAAVAGQGPVVLVEANALTEIGRSLTQLRDRTLVGGLDTKDVKRVQVKRGEQAVLLERRSDSEWRFLEGGQGAARGAKVEDVLWALRGLKWKEIVAPAGEALPKYGLDAPTAEIVLFRADGTTIVSVLVGKQDGDLRYVKTKAAPTVYAVDARQLEVPKVPDDF